MAKLDKKDQFFGQFYLPVGFPNALHIKGCDEVLPNILDTSTSVDTAADMKLVTIREFTMMRIMSTITDKPDWDTKVFNDEIVAKWRKELLENESGMDISEAMINWIEKELKFKAKVFQETGAISVYDGDVVKSDTAIPESVKSALKVGVARLEDVPEHKKDYHPGSDNQVLDLVHPSLFPLIYGRTRVITDRNLTISEGITCSGEGKILPKVKPIHQNDHFSYKFQWLPCEVKFKPAKSPAEGETDTKGDTDEGFRCEISSYINNLHPEDHSDLYRVIEEVLTRTVPLWNMTLTARKHYVPSLRIPCRGPEYGEIPKEHYPPRVEGEEEDDYEDRIYDFEFNNKPIIQPEPEAFRPPATANYRFRQEEDEWKGGSVLKPEDIFELEKDYKDSGIQVIVKLANIQLTPDKPFYPGGSWHVEGQLNERICATALYYYDSENITESTLSFRQRCSEEEFFDLNYEQGDDAWLGPYYGLEQDGHMIQDTGSVVTREDRLLSFPNIFQHHVDPFKLKDATKPGHRKILALFLIDPKTRIISTAQVPAQQRDWWQRQAPLNQALARLPRELRDEVVESIDDFPISMREAKDLRLELMEERKSFVVKHDKDLRDYTISLCEH